MLVFSSTTIGRTSRPVSLSTRITGGPFSPRSQSLPVATKNFRAFVAAPTQALVKHPGDGVEGRVNEKRRARAFDPEVRGGLDARLKLLHQA